MVKEDKSTQGFIESDETWMRPLNEFRDWLKAIREDKNKRDGVWCSGAAGTQPLHFRGTQGDTAPAPGPEKACRAPFDRGYRNRLHSAAMDR